MLNKIPGFRSGKPANKIIAVFGYILLLMSLLIQGSTAPTAKDVVINLLIIILTFAAITIPLANIFGARDKFYLFNRSSKRGKVVGYAGYVLVCVIAIGVVANMESETAAALRAERTAQSNAEEAAKKKAETDSQAQAKAQADEKAKQETDAKAKADAEAKAKQEQEALAKAEADAKTRAEADAKAKAEADAHKELSLGFNAADFKNKWNNDAGTLGVSNLKLNFQVNNGSVQDTFKVNFNSSHSMIGTVNKSDGKVREVTILAGGAELKDPGKAADVIITWGLLVQATNPGLSQDERGAILKELGVIGTDANLTNANKSTVKGNVKYTFSADNTLGYWFIASDARTQ